MARSPPRNEGWSGQEGQPPGSSVTQERFTPAGGERASPVTRSQPIWGVTGGACIWFRLIFETQAFPPLDSHPPVFPSGILEQDSRRMPALAQPVLGQRDRVVPDSPIGMGGSSPSLVPPVSGA